MERDNITFKDGWPLPYSHTISGRERIAKLYADIPAGPDMYRLAAEKEIRERKAKEQPREPEQPRQPLA